jgi:hypothetical protein
MVIPPGMLGVMSGTVWHPCSQTTGEYVGVVIDVLSGFGTHDTLLIQLKLSADDIESNSMR